MLWLPFIIYQLTHRFVDVRAALEVLHQTSQTSFDSFLLIVDLASGNAFVGKTGSGAPQYLATKLLRQRFGTYRVSTVPFPGLREGFDLYRLPPNAGSLLLRRGDIHPLDATLPNGMHLLGYEVAPTVTANQPVRLGIYWQVKTLPPPGEDYSFFSHLTDEQGKIWGQDDNLGYPPTLGRVGDTVVSWFTLKNNPLLPAGRGWIEIGVYRRSDVGRLPLRAADGTTMNRLLLGPLKLVPANPAVVPPPRRARVASFGERIDRLGYDRGGAVKPGGQLRLSLVWRSRRPPSADYKTFVHLVTLDGRIVAQSDAPPGPYPTTLWEVNEETRDDHVIQLPRNFPTGGYQLRVGLCRPDPLARLPSGADDYVTLAEPLRVP